MPCTCNFYGIAIYMYYRDHAPPHFHAFYGSDEAVFDIATGGVIAGQLPRRAQRLVEDWLVNHRNELQFNWLAATNGQTLAPVEPLD